MSTTCDYEKLAKLGEGSYGVVFKARHRTSGQVWRHGLCMTQRSGVGRESCTACVFWWQGWIALTATVGCAHLPVRGLREGRGRHQRARRPPCHHTRSAHSPCLPSRSSCFTADGCPEEDAGQWRGPQAARRAGRLEGGTTSANSVPSGRLAARLSACGLCVNALLHACA